MPWIYYKTDGGGHEKVREKKTYKIYFVCARYKIYRNTQWNEQKKMPKKK